MSNPEDGTILTLRISASAKQKLRIEAAHRGIDMSKLAREILEPGINEAEAKRLNGIAA